MYPFRAAVLALGLGLLMAASQGSRAQTAEPATAAARMPEAFKPVLDTRWRLVLLDGQGLEASSSGSRAPHLVFNTTSHRLSGSGGCNRLMSSFVIDGERLVIRHPARTQMSCLRGMEQEERIIEALSQVQRWKLDGPTLSLLDWQRRELLRLEREGGEAGR